MRRGPGFDVDRHEAQRLVDQFMNFIGLCRCGVPEAFLRQLQVGLEALAPAGQPRPELKSPGRGGWSPASNPAHLMTAYLLDCWDLSDHGSLLDGGWLTRAGVRLRDAMRLLDLADGSRDLDELLSSDGTWWRREEQLYPKGRDGSGVFSTGEWETDDD